MQNFKALTPIQKFYQNKTVFATGGTGFLGKVILEKLLYACDVKNVYLLTVPLEKGMNPQQQVQNLAKYKVINAINCVVENFHWKFYFCTALLASLSRKAANIG